MTKKEIYSKINLWLPPVLWAGLIFKLSNGTVPVASTVYWQDFAVKKSAHIFVFGILSILIYRALIGSGMDKKKAAIWAIVIAAFYGVTDEYHQSFTQGRESRPRDVGFDALGAMFAMFLVYNVLPNMPKEIIKLAKDFQII